jgi:Glycosyl transferase family 2
LHRLGAIATRTELEKGLGFAIDKTERTWVKSRRDRRLQQRFNRIKRIVNRRCPCITDTIERHAYCPISPQRSSSMTAPLVSILIPCYNAAPRLAACLQSCITQTYPHLEIILVDNNSTDASLAIAQRIAAHSPRPIHLYHCLQPGANYARNTAFTHSSGDYIQWLDADDELHPNKIALQVNALQTHPEIDIAYGDWDWHFYQNGEPHYQLRFAAQGMTDTLLQFLLHHWHPPHTYLLRRACAQQLHHEQAWYPGAPIGNDREYFTTAALLGKQFLWVAGAQVRYYTWSNAQLTRSTSQPTRATAHQQIFQRFQQHAKALPITTLSGDHWFLLNQDWHLWKLAPAQLSQMGTHSFWVQHHTQPSGISLTAAETRILLALNQLGGTCTIEDHAYRVLRSLWKHTAERIDSATVPTELERTVGLQPDLQPPQLLSAHSTAELDPAIAQRVAMIDAVPLYAPMFPEVRLAILQCLDKLRAVGLFTQVTLGEHPDVLPSSAVQTG